MGVLVGRKAPDFTVPAVLGDGTVVMDFNLARTIENKYAVLFFYPFDFSVVCPSELIALDHRLEAFKKRNVEVIAISIDSQNAHGAWRRTPINEGGIGPVGYTMAADVKHTISRDYDVENPATGAAFRAAFLLDLAGVVRHQVINDRQLGRDIDELLRVVDALQFTEEHGEMCPAGWKQGEQGITASPEGIAKYLSENADKL